MAGQPHRCGSVGEPNFCSNHRATAGWNWNDRMVEIVYIRFSLSVSKPLNFGPNNLATRASKDGSSIGSTNYDETHCIAVDRGLFSTGHTGVAGVDVAVRRNVFFSIARSTVAKGNWGY